MSKKKKPPMKVAKSNGSMKASADEGSAPKNHNKGVRKEIILKTIKKVVALEKQRDGITAEISALLNTNIKGDLGMKIADFKAALRVYRLEGEDREEFFDTLKETFKALGVGHQMNFLDEIEKQDAKAATVKDHTINDPQEGASAG